MADGASSEPSWEDPTTVGSRNDRKLNINNGDKCDEGAKNLSKWLYELELYAFNRNKGALRVSAHGPTTLSLRVATDMHWQGMTDKSESYLKRRHKALSRVEHASFESYHKKKFMRELSDTNWAWYDDEDNTLLDAESYGYYESPCAGTVTLEGFGLESWAHSGPHRFSIPVNYASLPEVPMCKLLRRVDELRRGGVRVGRSMERDLWDLLEMVGDNGLKPYTARRSPEKTLHIPDLYELLNRRDIVADLSQISSITAQAYATEGYALSDFATEERAKAEEFKLKGNRSMDEQDCETAIELYRRAIEIDGLNAVYRCNLSAALSCLERYWASQEAAFIATELDPRYAKAWAQLGSAELKLGRTIKAREAYKRAIEVAGAGATATMKQGLVDAQATIDATLEAIESEKDLEKQYNLRKAHEDQNWDVYGKDLHRRSLVIERQAEGLLVFAERIRWPYIDVVRDRVKDVYKNFEAGLGIEFHLHDRLIGVTLPGKWFSFIIMSALIMCTPSIAEDLGVAHYYESGLYLSNASYWRGALPPKYTTISDATDLIIETPSEAPLRGPDEEVEHYIADIEDASHWIIPEPPAQHVGNWEIKAIHLQPLSLEPDVAARLASGELDQLTVDNETEYRARIDFQMNDSSETVTYTLHTNLVFISLMNCFADLMSAHEVHTRELPRYQTNICTVEMLKDCVPVDKNADGIVIINATANGARVPAQAWCAENGKNAIIRTKGGPCFACAVRAAGKLGLGVGVLIWVS
ncbi:hypothetical protein BJX63DRAFT_437734 [Aspergillus granulosus]|uniref:Uncharacterized protein n=1 Tax=Aspergillus granulosus TaxID=176169 RepID=A0ABR4GU29_9EURO